MGILQYHRRVVKRRRRANQFWFQEAEQIPALMEGAGCVGGWQLARASEEEEGFMKVTAIGGSPNSRYQS